MDVKYSSMLSVRIYYARHGYRDIDHVTLTNLNIITLLSMSNYYVDVLLLIIYYY